MPVLVAYTRRSTELQEQSQETQELQIREWCQVNGHTLAQVYHEIPVSGGKKIERRPMLHQLLQDAKQKNRGFEGVVVWKLDRLAREPGTEYVIIGILEENRCQLFSVTEQVDRNTAAGRFMYHNMMGMRAYEREITGERIHSHNLSRAMLGKWAGGSPPLGFDYDKQAQTLTVNDRAAEVITVFEVYCESGGNASLTARTLNAMGMTTRHGNPWRDDAVSLIVKCPAYRRLQQYDGKAYPCELIPPLVPAELLTRTDKLIASIAPFVTSQRRGVYAYSSLLQCSVCGAHMKSNGGGSWVCRRKKESGLCDSRSVSNKYIDRLIGEAVTRIFKHYADELTSGKHAPKPKHDPARRERELQARRDRTVRAYIEGTIDEVERDKYLGEIEGQKQEKPKEGKALTAVDVRLLIGKLDEDWHAKPQDAKRALLLGIGASVTVCTAAEEYLWVSVATNLPIGTVSAKLKGEKYRKHRRHGKGGSEEPPPP
jgi:site-specific DNA recombinase